MSGFVKFVAQWFLKELLGGLNSLSQNKLRGLAKNIGGSRVQSEKLDKNQCQNEHRPVSV